MSKKVQTEADAKERTRLLSEHLKTVQHMHAKDAGRFGENDVIAVILDTGDSRGRQIAEALGKGDLTDQRVDVLAVTLKDALAPLVRALYGVNIDIPAPDGCLQILVVASGGCAFVPNMPMSN